MIALVLNSPVRSEAIAWNVCAVIACTNGISGVHAGGIARTNSEEMAKQVELASWVRGRRLNIGRSSKKMTPPSYNDIGVSYKQTRAADPRIVARLIAYLNLPMGATIADIGAGTGNYGFALAEHGYVILAVEPSSERARRQCRIPRSGGMKGRQRHSRCRQNRSMASFVPWRSIIFSMSPQALARWRASSVMGLSSSLLSTRVRVNNSGSMITYLHSGRRHCGPFLQWRNWPRSAGNSAIARW